MYTVPGFDELAQTLQASWKEHFKVVPPKSSGRNGILTGSMVYTKTSSNGRKYDDQIAFMGPPCTIIPPIKEGIVVYPKITLQLNRRDGKVDDMDPKDAAYAEERKAFMAFVKEVEEHTLAKVKEDPKAFFGGKDVKPANVFIKDSFVEPEEDNYRTKFTCKIDLKDEAQGARENIDWTLVRIDIHDVKMGANGEVEWTPLTLEDVMSRDKVLPIFRSAYPYFEVVKNHRNGELEGYCKIQWCLSGLQRIEKVHDPKRKRDDDNGAVNPSWMKKIKQYINEEQPDATTTTTDNNNDASEDVGYDNDNDNDLASLSQSQFNNKEISVEA